MHGLDPVRSARSLALGVGAALLALACGGSTPSPSNQAAPLDQQVLRVNSVTEPNSYDPSQETYGYEAEVAREVFQPLLVPKSDLSDVQPGAAQSYDVSGDGLTYTFHLRPDARWSDGRPVTAQDWVYGWKHLLNPALAAGYVDPFFDGTVAGGQSYGSVDVKSAAAIDTYLNGLGLSAPDDRTFVIKLQAPAGYFKWVASLWVATPLRRDVVEQAAGGAFPSTDTTKAEQWANDPRTIIGNGLFKISEIVPKDHVTLVPNTRYWAGPARLQRVVYDFLSDANTAFARYRTGELDMLNVPSANVDVVRGDPKLSAQAHQFFRLSSAWMTYNATRPLLDKPQVRLALSKSIDRDKLAKDVRKGTDEPISTFIPQGMSGFTASLASTQKFDPAAARKLLKDAGVTAAQLGQFKLLTRDTTLARTTNQYVAAQWKENLGVDIQIAVLDSKTVTQNLRRGQFDIYGPDGWFADYPDQQDWFDIFNSGACHQLNYACASMPGYDDLVKRADAAGSDSERSRLYAQAQKQLVESAPAGFILQGGEYDLVAPYIRGLKFTTLDDPYFPGGLSLHDVYIAKH
jgi:oligopeptide transport system substrate-binding protein